MEKMSRTVYFIRHAKTQANMERRYIGSSDESINEVGINQLSEKIRSGYYPEVDRVYTSPMRRCRETAEHIYPMLSLEIVPGFAEYNFGDFEGKTFLELNDDPNYQKWIESGGKDKTPGGEDMHSYKGRCCEAFEHVIEKIIREGIRNSALVIHGGTIMAILERYGESGKGFYDWQVPNCEGYKIVIDVEQWKEQRVIDRINRL